jgi:YegS/Rv2252/BmrU family lipid kinase
VSKVFAVLNPVAGNCDVDAVRDALRQHFGTAGRTYAVYETNGRERIADIVRAALPRHYDAFVAIGGDGTVSEVVDGLVHTGVPLGIVPVGTGNVVARDLGIPLDVDGALRLLADKHAVVCVDVGKADDRYYVLSAGVGISSLMMRDTTRQDKRRFGVAAYLWTGIKRLLGFQPHCFSITVDGRHSQWRASEVTIANSGAIGEPILRWGPNVRMDDGQLDVCIVRARNALDYLAVAWSVLLGRQRRDSRLHCLTAENSVRVESKRPLLVHADGEIIGETPVRIEVMPGAVQVIVPPETV